MAPMVQVEHLVKHFTVAGSKKPLQAVSDVSFAIGFAETLGIVGESGSGKTTIGLCVLRLIEPTSGRILIGGHDLSALPRDSLRVIRPQMQLVFQEPFGPNTPTNSPGRMLMSTSHRTLCWRACASVTRSSSTAYTISPVSERARGRSHRAARASTAGNPFLAARSR